MKKRSNGYLVAVATASLALAVALGFVVPPKESADPIITQAVVSPTPQGTLSPSASPAAIGTPAVTAAKKGQLQGHILMYHYVRVVDPAKDPLGFRLSVTAEELSAQLTYLSDHGYTSATMADIEAGKGDAHTVALTFDDGYEDFYTTAWPILQAHNWKATIYIITGMIGGQYMTWDQISELQKAGVEIGAHTITHPDLSKATEERQRTEIFQSKATLEQKLGITVHAFCYPSGKYTDTTRSIVTQAGYTTATTTNAGAVRFGDDPFTLHRIRVLPGLSGEALVKEF